jgi:DNA repair exonuclease SbcCD ATPase subunit
MNNEVDELLNAEQAIQDLLKELRVLKQQVGGYENATKSLDEVRNSLDKLVEKTSTLAEKTHSAVTVLAKIGTPEIIARTESLKLEVVELSNESGKKLKGINNVTIAGLVISVLSLATTLAILVKLFSH